ncbi:MAG: DNA internalization-related competence protein ComEC/Rec2 [Deltaproteobacteria bacterium]|nr:DNA internalization-related competence protein ComEC/Rec2 [Deltaproteobacteria bacterium]
MIISPASKKCTPEGTPENGPALWSPTLAGFFVAFTAGILTAPYFLFSIPLALAPAPFFLLLFVPQTFLTRKLLLQLLFFTLGLSLYHLDLHTGAVPGQIGYLAGKEVCLRGQILEVSPRPDHSVLKLAAEQLMAPASATPVEGKIQIALEETGINLVPGDRIQFRSRLRLPGRFGTPGEFDYPRHLAGTGVQAVAHLPSSGHLVRFPTSSTDSFRIRVEKSRRFLGWFLDAFIPPEKAPYLKAILIGDRGGLTKPQQENLATLGLAHLFSISGLHLGILFGILYPLALFLIRRSERMLILLGPPRRFIPLLLIPPLGCYLLLAGNGIPARRAFWMILLGAALLFFYHRSRPLSLLLAAAFGLLLFSPPVLFSPSFQLSFIAVFAILRWAPAWSPQLARLPRCLRYPTGLFLVTLCATAATFPIVLCHFHLAPAAGLINNLFAVPLIAGLALPVTLAAAPLIAVYPDAAILLLGFAGKVIDLTLFLSKTVADLLPGTDSRFYPTPPETLGLLLALGILLFWRWQSSGKLRTILALALSATVFLLPCDRDETLTVTPLSVGQGNAILVSLDGDHYLVDGGGLPTSRFDIGARIVAPALARLGVRKLKAVVLSHAHPDHYLGLIHILAHFPVAEFWTGLPVPNLPESLQNIIRERAVPVITFPQGWTARQGSKGETLWIFTPDQDNPDINNRSLAFYLCQGDHSLLLTGDLEDQGIKQLLAGCPLKNTTLLNLPHHGSFSNGVPKLLSSFSPRMAFISVGKNNPHRLPHPKTLAAAKRVAVPVFRTDQQGTLRFRGEGRNWEVRHWERGLFR